MSGGDGGSEAAAREALETRARALAQRQLDAWNAGDADAFAACFAEDVEVVDLPSGEVTMRGRALLRERYAALFARHPDQRCRLLHRIVHGRMVVDHEEVTGRAGEPPLHAVALYAIEGDTIARMLFLRP